MARANRGPAEAHREAVRPSILATASCLFVLALAVRWLFWRATADAGWPGSALYKGDAWLWLEHARALAGERSYELGLPLRPPGMAYLIEAVWNSRPDGLVTLKLFWCVQGALAVALFYAAAARAFGARVGLAVGLWCAGSFGLMALATSLNNETPYLVLLALVLWLSEGVRRAAASGWSLMLWGGCHALACLVRVEHALFFALSLIWLIWCWQRDQARGDVVKRVAWVAVAWLAVLAPWQAAVWRAVAEFNEGPVEVRVETERLQQQHESGLSHLVWQPSAVAERERMPAFAARPAANFVAATVAYRGGVEVSGTDFELLDDAFGYRPRPLARRPFVVITGALNFALANHGASTGGFDAAPLLQAPPLVGGASVYPAAFVSGLPPLDLAFTYPPHLRLVNEGYSEGLRWIVSEPGAALRLVGRKLAIFWRGVSLGWSGWNLPLGQGGRRLAVDLVTPEGSWPAAWRWLLLVVALAGVAELWRRQGGQVWLVFLASKLIVAVAFYGYARQGASVTPVVALLVVLAVRAAAMRAAAKMAGRALAWPQGWRLPGVGSGAAWWLSVATLMATLMLALEGGRFLAHPEVMIDGRVRQATDLLPPGDHLEHEVGFR